MFDGLISVYRNAIDVFFYVIGSAKENELILAHVLSTFMEALALLFRSVLPADRRVRTMVWRLNVPARLCVACSRNQVEKRTILENYDALVLTLDELIDDGYATVAHTRCPPITLTTRTRGGGQWTGQNHSGGGRDADCDARVHEGARRRAGRGRVCRADPAAGPVHGQVARAVSAQVEPVCLCLYKTIEREKRAGRVTAKGTASGKGDGEGNGEQARSIENAPGREMRRP